VVGSIVFTFHRLVHIYLISLTSAMSSFDCISSASVPTATPHCANPWKMPASSTGSAVAEFVIFDYYMLIAARLGATSVLPHDASIEDDIDEFVQDLLDLPDHPDVILLGQKNADWIAQMAVASLLKSDQARLLDASLIMTRLAGCLRDWGRYQESGRACELATQLERIGMYEA